MINKIASLTKRFSGSIALLSGAISALGFAPIGWWPITILSIAVLIYLLIQQSDPKSSFRIAWLWGVGHFSVTLKWIAFAFTFQESLPLWMGWGAVFGLSCYLAIYPALAAASGYIITYYLTKKLPIQKPITFIMALSAAWIISEWLRGTLFTGFGWNPLSASMVDTNLIRFLPWIGSYGVSGILIVLMGFLVIIANGFTRRNISVLKSIGGAAIIIAIIGLPVSTPLSDKKDENTPYITVVQPNISQADKYRESYNQINYQKLSQLSKPLAKNINKPHIILWPEAAIPDYLEKDYPRRSYYDTMGGSAQNALNQLGKLLNKDDILMLGGTRLKWEGNSLVGARNSVMALQKDKDSDSANLFATYDKTHLLPMGEYVPLRSILEPIGIARFVPGSIDFWPGEGPASITIPKTNKTFGGIKIGIQICYELVFSGRVTDRKNRPDFIFSPSNDAWFGPWGPPQHEAQGRLRAIEEGLPVIRTTPTGVSSIIQKNGRVTERIAAGIAGRIDASIPSAGPPTFFAKYGNIIPIILAWSIILALGISTIAIARWQR